MSAAGERREPVGSEERRWCRDGAHRYESAVDTRGVVDEVDEEEVVPREHRDAHATDHDRRRLRDEVDRRALPKKAAEREDGGGEGRNAAGIVDRERLQRAVYVDTRRARAVRRHERDAVRAIASVADACRAAAGAVRRYACDCNKRSGIRGR